MAGSRTHRTAILVAGAASAVALGLILAGVVHLPDLQGALADLADRLGPWTYALVAGMAFLETGAFVGLIAPGETAVVLGGVWPRRATSRCRSCWRSPGWPPRWATWPATRWAAGWAARSSCGVAPRWA